MSKLYKITIEQTAAKELVLRARSAQKARNKAIAGLHSGGIELGDMPPKRTRIAVGSTAGDRIMPFHDVA
jgi:hypothetical protein